MENSLEENLEILHKHNHSWLPLCRGGLSDLLGVVRTQQALLLFTASPAPHTENFVADMEALAHAPVFVPEAVSSLDLLKLFQEKGMHTAFIVDEYGTLQGLVTLRDILEILAGQMGTPHEDTWAVKREDGSWLIDGSIPLPELKDLLGIRRLPDENEGHYSILSGMLMYLEGRIPTEGDCITCCGWIFEVIDMDGNKIDKLLVREAPSSVF
ncbi:MAG: CBS domain-containing protein [Mailhella sp.]|nr:CBS domain-containing protein [Mailhella sp.]